MKPYFAEYIRVEGKIKSNDDFFLRGEVYNCRGRDEGMVWYDNGLSPEYVAGDPGECEKALLHICSRNIQVGDRFNSANGTGFICSRMDNEKIYSIGGLSSEVEEVPHTREYCYRVIG